MAVNVSARQYRQSDFLENVQETLAVSAIDPARLVLEVTESMMLDVAEAIGKMNALQALGLEVVAEGVETQPQRYMLVRKGCQRFQDYLFSRPVPIEEFEALL